MQVISYYSGANNDQKTGKSMKKPKSQLAPLKPLNKLTEETAINFETSKENIVKNDAKKLK